MTLLHTVALLAVLSFLMTVSSDNYRPGLQKIPITCHAGTFSDGQNAEITCNFHRQMDLDQRGISVVRYPLYATNGDLGTDILLCEWKESKYDCWKQKNYTFDDVVTDRLTLEIPSVSREFGGLYYCFIVRSEDTQQHACELKIKDKNRPRLQKTPITCHAGTFSDGQDAEITCNFHRQMDLDQRGISVVRYPFHATNGDLGTDILLCEWKESKYDCWKRKNYTFDGVITDRLTLEIPSVSREFGGLYYCFIVHSEDTQKHACELKIKGSDVVVPVPKIPEGNGTDVQSPKDEAHLAWIAAIVVLPALVLVGVFVFRKFIKKIPQEDTRQQTDEEVPLVELNHGGSAPEEKASQSKLKALLEPFRLSNLDYERMSKLLYRQIVTTCDADKMLKRVACVRSLPKGTEKGGFLSVGIGPGCVDIQHVHLSGGCTEPQSATYNLTMEDRTNARTGGTYEDTIFFRIANVVAEFLKNRNLYKKVLPAEYVIISNDRVDNEVTIQRLIECVPGLDLPDDFDREATYLQQAAFRRKNATRGLKIRPTVKEPMGTFLSGVYHDPSCSAAFLPEVEFSTCYTSGSAKNTRKQEREITTISFGVFGETGCLDIFRTDFDRELDRCSANPGENILEKMVSWNHLGEILRLVLLELSKDEVLSQPISRESALHKTGGLTVRQTSLIESDFEGQNRLTQLVLEELSLKNYTDDDCNIVREVFKSILGRSARLAAAVLAALITHLRQPGVTIAVDGFMRRDHPYFYEVMEEMTLQLVPENLKDFKLSPQYHGRHVGAAVAAVLSSQTATAAETSESKPVMTS